MWMKHSLIRMVYKHLLIVTMGVADCSIRELSSSDPMAGLRPVAVSLSPVSTHFFQKILFFFFPFYLLVKSSISPANNKEIELPG